MQLDCGKFRNLKQVGKYKHDVRKINLLTLLFKEFKNYRPMEKYMGEKMSDFFKANVLGTSFLPRNGEISSRNACKTHARFFFLIFRF